MASPGKLDTESLRGTSDSSHMGQAGETNPSPPETADVVGALRRRLIGPIPVGCAEVQTQPSAWALKRQNAKFIAAIHEETHPAPNKKGGFHQPKPNETATRCLEYEGGAHTRKRFGVRPRVVGHGAPGEAPCVFFS